MEKQNPNNKYLINKTFKIFVVFIMATTLAACARMGQPDGGWFDETPPRVINASPKDKELNVKTKKIFIDFNEYIKLENPTEKIVVSPPQIETPEIKGQGKKIAIILKDSLKTNTTYTIDFSDAITDNNEGNPLGNYTYSFSTGNKIDTMQVAGNVVDAKNLEPIKGILVGLYEDKGKHTFDKTPMERVARTDSRGRFVIKGVKQQIYKLYALKDVDGDYKYSQKSEQIAFYNDNIIPLYKNDVRQDTVWRDSLHIDSIITTPFIHYLPDNIVLRAFLPTQTDRHLLKVERKEPEKILACFSYGNKKIPVIKGLNFNEQNAFITEKSEKNDTITYWIKDSALINQDTLRMQMQYLVTDSTGTLVNNVDTLELIPNTTYQKRLKEKEKKIQEWKKTQEKAKKKGEKYQEKMPVEAIEAKFSQTSEIAPDENIIINFPKPINVVDKDKIHLYLKKDTTWYKTKFLLKPVNIKTKKPINNDTLKYKRNYILMAEWKPGLEYSLEADSMAFVDIYGKCTGKIKKGFAVGADDKYGTLLMNIEEMKGKDIVVQLLNAQDEPIKETTTQNGIAEFYYIKPGKYYMRMFVDSNKNGLWDTGNYYKKIQPEQVYYYPEEIECKEKWDYTLSWQPTKISLAHQKPEAITKQKGDKAKRIKRQNADRARKLGIELPKNLR